MFNHIADAMFISNHCMLLSVSTLIYTRLVYFRHKGCRDPLQTVHPSYSNQPYGRRLDSYLQPDLR